MFSLTVFFIFHYNKGALSLAVISFFFDFLGIFFGLSIFDMKINAYQILSHFIGGILLCWLITNNWNSETLWPIIITTNLPTGLIEFVNFIGWCFFKNGMWIDVKLFLNREGFLGKREAQLAQFTDMYTANLGRYF